MDETGLLSIEWGVYGIPETFIVDNGLVKYIGMLVSYAKRP